MSIESIYIHACGIERVSVLDKIIDNLKITGVRVKKRQIMEKKNANSLLLQFALDLLEL